MSHHQLPILNVFTPKVGELDYNISLLNKGEMHKFVGIGQTKIIVPTAYRFSWMYARVLTASLAFKDTNLDYLF